jgi:phosphate transport system protein
LKPYADLLRMAQAVNSLVRDALDAFVREDPQLAAAVCAKDRFVNELERVADHATNIAEMVIFMVNGKDIRHAALGA